MPPQPIYFWPYCTYNSMYATYVVPHHTNIPSLKYLHIPTSIITSSMLENTLPPEARPTSSRMMSEHRVLGGINARI